MSESNQKPDQSAPASQRVLPGRPFVAGNPGRPKGIKDRRSQVKEELLKWFISGDRHQGPGKLKPFHQRIRELANDADSSVRLSLERHFFDQAFGKAKETVDVFHQSAVVADARSHMKDFLSSWSRELGAERRDELTDPELPN